MRWFACKRCKCWNCDKCSAAGLACADIKGLNWDISPGIPAGKESDIILRVFRIFWITCSVWTEVTGGFTGSVTGEEEFRLSMISTGSLAFGGASFSTWKLLMFLIFKEGHVIKCPSGLTLMCPANFLLSFKFDFI